eukprot:6492606-Amphidinium_carterae.1
MCGVCVCARTSSPSLQASCYCCRHVLRQSINVCGGQLRSPGAHLGDKLEVSDASVLAWVILGSGDVHVQRSSLSF